jgi:hypothetical protein
MGNDWPMIFPMIMTSLILALGLILRHQDNRRTPKRTGRPDDWGAC